MSQVVSLNCSVDGQSFDVSVAVARRIGILRPLLEMASKLPTQGGVFSLPIEEVRGALMARVIEYLTVHQADPIRREPTRKQVKVATPVMPGGDSDSEDDNGMSEPVDQYENDDFYYER